MLAAAIAPKMFASSMMLNPKWDSAAWYRFGASTHFAQIYTFFYGIFWVPRITHANRAVFEAYGQRMADTWPWWTSATNVSYWTITEFAPDGVCRVPAADRDEYYPNQFRAPEWSKDTAKIWGFDMLSEPSRAYCVCESRRTGNMTVSFRKYITQLPSWPYGLGICIHVYWEEPPPTDPLSDDVTPRVMTLTKTPWAAGVVSATLYLDALLSATLQALHLDRCTVFLFDMASNDSESYLSHFVSPQGRGYDLNALRYAGQTAVRGDLQYSTDFLLGDRPLRIVVTSTDNYLKSSHTFLPALFLVLSVASSLSGYAVWLAKDLLVRIITRVKSSPFHSSPRRRFSLTSEGVRPLHWVVAPKTSPAPDPCYDTSDFDRLQSDVKAFTEASRAHSVHVMTWRPPSRPSRSVPDCARRSSSLTLALPLSIAAGV